MLQRAMTAKDPLYLLAKGSKAIKKGENSRRPNNGEKKKKDARKAK